MVQSIPASAIVSVIPNVLSAGGSALDLNGLVLTTSTRVPTDTVAGFANPLDVEDFFGPSSDEAAAAVIYFKGYDNSNVKPGQILFSQYNPTDVAAYERGGDIAGLSLTELQAISGNLTITVDGYARTGDVDLSGATSFSGAATTIGTAVNGSLATEASVTGAISGTILTVSAVGSGTLAVGQTLLGAGVTAGTRITALGSGTGGTGTYTVNNTQNVASEALTTEPTPVAVTFDAVSGALVITSGLTGVISTVAFATNTIAASLKLTEATGAALSQGAAAAVPGTFMDALIQQTQNWASFMTLFDPDNSGHANKLAFAAWTSAQDNRYGYACWDTDTSPRISNPATGSLGYDISQAGYSGTLLISCPTYEKAAFACGIPASLNFTQTNGRATFAFRSQTGLTADITNQSQGDNLIANGYNFYGAYATANDRFVWLYPGKISGDFLWADSYFDQIWLNNSFQLALMELLANVGSIPYNTQGYALIEAACMDVIQAGLNFGAFRPGVTLSNEQVAEVNNAAGTNIAPTLQTQGWYLQVKDAAPSVRAARGSPPCTFWYMDGQSVQKIALTSVELQ